jgi:polyketide synthase PksJ
MTGLDQGFYSLLYLAQAIGEHYSAQKIGIYVIADHMQEVTGDERLMPAKAALSGPVGVIPLEYPQVNCTAIDIQIPERGTPQEDLLVRQLSHELQGEAVEGFVAFRGNHRLVRVFEPAPLPDATDSSLSRLKDKGVYLVTGGLGGIGMVLAEHLARRVKARLILTGRSFFPARGGWEQWVSQHPGQDRISLKIQQLKLMESLGAEITVCCADVTAYQDMYQVVKQAKEQWGVINGVIHCAGLPGGGMIQRKTREDAWTVMAPKIRGTLVVDQVLKDMEMNKGLDFFLLCSSINSVLAMLGQVDYYGANAFLDAFAFYKNASDHTFTVSVNWDTWQEVGMAKEAALRGLGITSTDHPLLEHHIQVQPGVEAYLTHFSFLRHWVLHEHMTPDKRGLLPGTAYLEMACAALRFQPEMGNGGIEVRDVQFLSPLVVAEGEEIETALILKKHEHGFEFKVVSRFLRQGDGQSGQRTHAVGQVGIIGSPQHREPQVHTIKSLEALCDQDANRQETGVKSKSGQTPLLVFGPHWNAVNRIKYGKNQGLAFLELDDAYRDDSLCYKLHPSLLDIAAGFLYSYINNASAYIPYGYKRLILFKELPSRIYSHSRWLENKNPGKEFLTFNITIMDETGVEVALIEEFTMMEVSDAVKGRVLGAISRTPGETGKNDAGDLESVIFDRWDLRMEMLQKGLQPAEGVEVLDRVLSVPGILPQIVISTVDLAARLKVAAAGPQAAGLERLPTPSKTLLPVNPRPELRSVYVAPKSETERLIARLWQEVLGIDKIGIHDDFFELGGDSLNIMQLNGILKKELNRDIPVPVLFRYLTIHSFILGYLHGDQASSEVPGQEGNRSDVIKKGKDRLKTRIGRSSRIRSTDS